MPAILSDNHKVSLAKQHKSCVKKYDMRIYNSQEIVC